MSTYLPAGEDENVTAGSVGAIPAPTSPASIQLNPSTSEQRAGDEPRREEGSENTEREYGPKLLLKACGPDLEPAVEEDYDEGNRCEVLDLPHGDSDWT